MSLDKAIEHGKEKRKKLTFAKSIDKHCRNHGGCSWCLGNRIHKYKKKMRKAEYREDNNV